MSQPIVSSHELAVEAYGVPIAIGVSDSDLLAHAAKALPPRSTQCPPGSVGQRFGLIKENGIGYRVVVGDTVYEPCTDLELSVGTLDAFVRSHIAINAPNRIFVHAGVVSYGGRAIVLPGTTFSGKTTLVVALIQAGAVYYSEEYAVFDEFGLVHPYPKPFSIRDHDQIAVDWPAETFGGSPGSQPVPVGLVGLTSYKPGARWNPRRATAGEGMLGLLENTIPARERPTEALRAASRALTAALVLEGERGEAEEAAMALLDAVASAGSTA